MSDLVKQIKIKDETYDDLIELSTNKNDTFDSIIRKCIEAYKKASKK